MTTITEFLLARIDEDEAAAQAATKGPWTVQLGGHDIEVSRQEFTDDPEGLTIYVEDDPEWFSDAEHMSRFNPARVLAECAAKRAIVQMALDSERYGYGTVTDGVKRETLGLAVRALATVYADHPDYLEEWAL